MDDMGMKTYSWSSGGMEEDGEYVLYSDAMAAIARASLPVVVPDDEYLRNLLAEVRDVRSADDVAFGWYEAIECMRAPTVKADQVRCDPRDIAGDTGRADVDAMIGRLTSADPDFNDCADAAALLRRLVMEEIIGPAGYATWRDAAVAERVKRVAMKPKENIVQIANDGLEVYAGPNMNERKVCAEIVRLAEVYSTEQAPPLPAAGSAGGEVSSFRLPDSSDCYGFGYVDGTCIQSLRGARNHLEDLLDAIPGEPLMTVAQHNRIVAALSAQQSAPERVSVPVELMERSILHMEWFGNAAAKEVQELHALLSKQGGGE